MHATLGEVAVQRQILIPQLEGGIGIRIVGIMRIPPACWVSLRTYVPMDLV